MPTTAGSWAPVAAEIAFTGRNALSVDVEEWFQVGAMADHIPRASWSSLESRVAGSTRRVLELLAAGGARATFFVLGGVAERHPAIVREIVAAGHELASHGWDHTRADRQSPAAFRADVRRAKELLEAIGGTPVAGYRATSYSIGADNLWALEILQEEGHSYSSSIFPARRDHYGMADAPRFPYRHRPGGLLEIPPATVRLAGRNLPAAGGGWFRLYPYALSRRFIRRINHREQRPALFFFHPWEIDPGQPRPAGLPWRTRFRHRVNLEQTAARIQRLCADFTWERIDRVFAMEEAAHG